MVMRKFPDFVFFCVCVCLSYVCVNPNKLASTWCKGFLLLLQYVLSHNAYFICIAFLPLFFFTQFENKIVFVQRQRTKFCEF